MVEVGSEVVMSPESGLTAPRAIHKMAAAVKPTAKKPRLPSVSMSVAETRMPAQSATFSTSIVVGAKPTSYMASVGSSAVARSGYKSIWHTRGQKLTTNDCWTARPQKRPTA